VKKLRLALSEAAAADIVEQADWYEEQSGPRLARRWEKAVTSTLLCVLDNPQAGSICTFSHAELSDARRVLVPGCPKHLVLYQFRAAEIFVFRVLHCARDLACLFSGS